MKIALTREEVFYVHRGRHPVLMWIKTGFTKDGAITGMHFRSWLDGGAYGSYGVASTFYTGALQTVTYKIPVVQVRGRARLHQQAAVRPQARPRHAAAALRAWSARSTRPREQLGLDPADMRRRNLAEPFTKTANHLTVTTIGLGECIDRVVEASGWRDKRGPAAAGQGHRHRVLVVLTGAGTAIYWNDMPHSGVVVRADRSGLVAVLCGATDIGQGSDSILAYLVAEVLGIEPKDIRVHPADTDLTPVDLGSYSSRVTLMAGNAGDPGGRAAARAASSRRWRRSSRWSRRGSSPATGASSWRTTEDRGVSFPEAVALGESMFGVLAFPGSYAPPKRAGKYKGGGVGPVALLLVLGVRRRGGRRRGDRRGRRRPRSGSPTTSGARSTRSSSRGRSRARSTWALGEALMEEQVFRKGVHKIPSLLEYKSPTTLETPEIHTILVETDDPEGPFGAKEAGQGPLLPVIPAVANAGLRRRRRADRRDADHAGQGGARRSTSKRQGKAPRVGPERLPLFTFPAPRAIESAFGEPAADIAERPFSS